MSTSTVNTSSPVSRVSKFPLNLFTCCITQNSDDDIERFFHQDKNIICHQCHTIFTDKKQLKKHKKIKFYCDAFSTDVNVKCPQCHNIFLDTKELYNHRKIGYYCECLSTDINNNKIND